MRKKLARPMTQKRVKGLVSYNKVTGKFVSRRNGNPLGSIGADGYLVVQLGVKVYYLHRLAWLYVYGYLPEGVIDHIDHNKCNNAIDNLREVAQTDNCKNKKLPKNNSSGFVGVRWNTRLGKWTAEVKVGRKSIYLGAFQSLEEAVNARQRANEEYSFHENHGKPLIQG